MLASEYGALKVKDVTLVTSLETIICVILGTLWLFIEVTIVFGSTPLPLTTLPITMVPVWLAPVAIFKVFPDWAPPCVVAAPWFKSTLSFFVTATL